VFSTLVVGEARLSGTVRGAEDAVLLEQVVNDGLLVPLTQPEEQFARDGVDGNAPPPQWSRLNLQ
jgi:hypothetical protein